MPIEKFPYMGPGQTRIRYAGLLLLLIAACSSGELVTQPSANVVGTGAGSGAVVPTGPAAAVCGDPNLMSCAGVCLDVRSDPRNCGRCGVDCGFGTCSVGACVCQSDLTACAMGCTDTFSDRTNCGVCGKACAATERCQLGQCTPLEAVCNPQCAPGQQCLGGVCQCAQGLSLCAGVCVDPLTTPQHCGACGNMCASGQLCQAGQCVCPAGQLACASGCVDVQTSSTDCGACGTACAAGEACMAGQCRAPLGADGCGGTARDVSVSEVAAYQSVKVTLAKGMMPLTGDARGSDVVAGRKTLFRVSVTPASGFAARELSARVIVKNGATMDQYFAKQRISKASTDADTASTFQVPVPAEKITVDTTYSVELVECGAAAMTGAVQQARFPAMGESPLDARKTGVLKVKVIPLTANNRTPETTETALKVYKDYLEAMYPIEKAEITVGEPVMVAYPVNWNRVIDQLRQLRQQQRPAADIYYYGMLRPTETLREYCRSGCTAGVGYVGSATQAQTHVSLGLAYADEMSAGVMAHEVGHNHGRNHAPCAPGGNIAGVDRNYPNDDAATEVWGYDSRKQTFFEPTKTKDIMGYCEPKWVGDYTYNGLVDRVATMNQQMLQLPATYSQLERQAFQVMLVDPEEGPHWSQPFAEPDEAFGDPEEADVLDIDGQAIERVTVYRTLTGDQDASTVLVPPARQGWNALRTLDGHVLPFSAPVTVPRP